MAKLLYTCGGNFKTEFHRILPENLKHLNVGSSVMAEELGFKDSEEFCLEIVGTYDHVLDHSFIDILEIENTDFLPPYPKTLPADAYPKMRVRTIQHNGLSYVWSEKENLFVRNTEKESQAIAARFNNILKQDLSKAEMEEIQALNGTPDYPIPGACPTHNFLDSNQTMLDAFQFIMDREAIVSVSEHSDNSLDMEIMDEAWRIARMKNYKN